MRKVYITIMLFYLQLMRCIAQSAEKEDTSYKSRQLHIDEINLVSSYYAQDGNNSAVTGGIGTEKLTDFSNDINLKLSRYDSKERLHTINFDLGFDTYSSASSDNIDPNTISGASSQDIRIYPSLAWNVANTKKRSSIEAAGYFSAEYDYRSIGMGLSFTKTSKDESRELGIKLNTFFDTWEIILPIELRSASSPTSAPRNTYNASLSLTQIINNRFQISWMVDPTFQEGLLGTKYQRVYFTDNSVRSENLPDTRWKFASGIRAHYFLGDRIVLRGFYRYYTDEWKLTAHTWIIETPVKITPFISVSPFYRYYMQDGIPYFAPYGKHLPTDRYFTSDYDLKTLSSQAIGAGIKWMPRHGTFGIPSLNTLEVRYEHYIRSTALIADIVTIGLKFKPDFNIP